MPNEIRGFGYIDKSKDFKLINEFKSQSAHNVKLDEGIIDQQSFEPSINTYGQSCTYLNTVYSITTGGSISNGSQIIGITDPDNANIELKLTTNGNISFNNKNVDNLDWAAKKVTSATTSITFKPISDIVAPSTYSTNSYWAAPYASQLPTDVMKTFKLAYVPLYNVSYIVHNDTVLEATLSITGTVATATTAITCTVASVTHISATGQLIKINDEYILTGGATISSPSVVFTGCTRGVFDTVATNHDTGDTVTTKHGVIVGHNVLSIVDNSPSIGSGTYKFAAAPMKEASYQKYDITDMYYVFDGNKPTNTQDWETWYKGQSINIKGLPSGDYFDAFVNSDYIRGAASSSYFSATSMQTFTFPTQVTDITWKSMSNVTTASVTRTNLDTFNGTGQYFYYDYYTPSFGDYANGTTYVTATDTTIEDVRVRAIKHYLRPSWTLVAFKAYTPVAGFYYFTTPVYADIYIDTETVTNATTPTSVSLSLTTFPQADTTTGYINNYLFNQSETLCLERTWQLAPKLSIEIVKNQLGTFRYGITLVKSIGSVDEESVISVLEDIVTVTGNEGQRIQYTFPFLEYDATTGTYISAYDADEINVYHQRPDDTDFTLMETIDISDYAGLTYAQLIALNDDNIVVTATEVLWQNFDTFTATGNVLTTENNYPPPNNADYIISWSNRLWVAVDNVIWYSIDGNSNFFGELNFFELDGNITGLAVINEQLVISTTKGVGRISGYDENTFQLKMIATDINVLSGSLVAFKNRGYFIVSGEGVYVTDSVSVEKMGYEIGRTAETSLTSIHNVKIDDERYINWETTTGSPYYMLSYDTLLNGFFSTTYISSAYVGTSATIQTYWRSKEFTFDMPDMRKNIPQMAVEYIGDVAIEIYKDNVLTSTVTLTTSATRTWERFWIDDTKFYSMSFKATLTSSNSRVYAWKPLRFKK